MPINTLWSLMSEVDRDRELRWAKGKHDALERFVLLVRSAMHFNHSPKARKALYDQWIEEYGADLAREPAKYVEAAVKGQVSVDHLEKMLQAYRRLLAIIK